MIPFFKKYRYPLALLLIWLLAVVVVNPRGEFPLNDDFSFAKSVFNLCVQGQFHLDDWLAMTLLTQLFYGALWCGVFGFGFEVLRYSTLFLALGGLLLCYRLLLRLGGSAGGAFFCTLVLAFNPLFFSLAFTFMTDVHFLVWMMAAIYLWMNYLQEGSKRFYVFALLATMALVLLRQTGLMVALAAGLALVYREGSWLRSWPKALMPLLLCSLGLAVYYTWLKAHQGLPATFGQPGKLFENLTDAGHLAALPERIVVLIAYLGMFTLPVTMAFIPEYFSEGKKWPALLVIPVYLFAAWCFREKIPWGNLFYNLGLGPPTLKDGQFFLNLKPQLSGWGLEGLRLLFITAGGWFLWCVISLATDFRLSAGKLLILGCAGAYLAFLLSDTYAFDRYFLVLLPLLLFLFPFGKIKRQPRPVAWAMLLVVALFSVAATHDYLAWNRARWRALHQLMEQHSIPPSQIDGGFEFNGWYRPGRIEHGRAKSWWWVAQDNYCITFGPLDGYRCLEKYPFRRWLPPTADSLCILKKH